MSNQQSQMNKLIWNHNRDARLLDRIDQHPIERSIIFEPARNQKGSGSTPEPGKTMSKVECYALASQAVFSVDEDPALRKKLAVTNMNDLKYSFGRQIFRRLDSWSHRYQAVNRKIKLSKPNMRLENIARFEEIEAEVRSSAEVEFDRFPIWDRVHVHWRTNSMYNKYYKDKTQKNGAPNQIDAKRRRNPRRDNGSTKSLDAGGSSAIIVIDSEEEGVRSTRSPSHDGVREPVGKALRHGGFKIVNSLKRKSTEISKDFEASTSRESDVPAAKGSTATQEHERRILELRIELQKLENEALEKKSAADLRRFEIEVQMKEREHEDQRAKERHELRMKMI